MQKDPFADLMALLVETHRLDEDDAKIYVLGLKKGIITSGNIVKEKIISRQPTASDRLRRLTNEGYFECTLDEQKMRGKGHTKKYKAIPPEVVLQDYLRNYGEIHACIEKIKEHRELLSETTELENEIWLLKPQKVAMNRTATMIRSAKQNVKIFSHDCTWFYDTEIKDSLGRAISNKVPVQLFATEADERITNGLKKMGISLIKSSAVCLPFCLVDDSLLLLPCSGGVLSTEYFVISTRQKYLVDNFIGIFNSLSNWSKKNR